jgi:hypothetical protein
MPCETGKQLQDRFRQTTSAYASHPTHSGGVPGFNAFQEEERRLKKENNDAREAFEEHVKGCAGCSQHDWTARPTDRAE